MRIGIVGLGLMGGSIASALKSHHEISAYDQDESALLFAMTNGLIDHAYTSSKELFENVDVVYLCIYPLAIIDFMKQHQREIPPGTVIVDIAGVKCNLIAQIEEFLRPDLDFVFSHPIAGREKIGVIFSKSSIFLEANYVIVPTKKNQPSNLQLVHDLALEMGFKTISYLSGEEHDSIIAYTSQLAHVLSLALVDSDDEHFDTKRFIGDSYRDLTRIAMINESLWSELLLSNRDHLLERIRHFQASLNKYVELLEKNDLPGLQKQMLEDRNKRANLEKGDK